MPAGSAQRAGRSCRPPRAPRPRGGVRPRAACAAPPRPTGRTAGGALPRPAYVRRGGDTTAQFGGWMSARHERGAMILTPNRGFAEWGEGFGGTPVAPPVLGKLLHPP